MGTTIYYSYYFEGSESILKKKLETFSNLTGVKVKKNVIPFNDLPDSEKPYFSSIYAKYIRFKAGLDVIADKIYNLAKKPIRSTDANYIRKVMIQEAKKFIPEDLNEKLAEIDSRLPELTQKNFESIIEALRFCEGETFKEYQKCLAFTLASAFGINFIPVATELLKDKTIEFYIGVCDVDPSIESFVVILMKVSDHEWFGSDFTKTNNRRNAHLKVISLLQILNSLDLVLEVNDEAGYWNNPKYIHQDLSKYI